MDLYFHPFPRLMSERLSLEPLSNKHIPKLYLYHSKKENFPYAQMNVHQSIDDTKKYVKKMTKGVFESRWIIWAICLKSSREIIGTISIWNFNQEKLQGELGYGLFPDYRSSGYMQEALKRVLAYAFNEIELEGVKAYTSAKNIPSIRLLEGLNFDYIEIIEDDYSGGKRMSIYQINREKFINLYQA